MCSVNNFKYSPSLETLDNSNLPQTVELQNSNHPESDDLLDSSLLSALSEYDLFLRLIGNKICLRETLPKLEGELLRNFKLIVVESFNLYYTKNNSTCSLPTNIKALINAVLTSPNPNENFSNFLQSFVDVYGSSAYNLIPIAWYYLFLNLSDKNLHDCYLVRALLFQFIRHSQFKSKKYEIISTFNRINDLDIRVRFPTLKYQHHLMALGQRIDRYVQNRVFNSTTPVPIQFTKRFLRWEPTSGEHFTIRTFTDFSQNVKKEIDLVICGGNPQSLFFTDSIYIPLEDAISDKSNPDVTPKTFNGNETTVVTLRIAKVMLIERADCKSPSSIWTILSNYTEEWRLNPSSEIYDMLIESSQNDEIEIELWKTALLFAAFENDATAYCGKEECSSDVYFNYKQLPISSLKHLKDKLFGIFSTLPLSAKESIANSLAKSMLKRINDHFAEQSENGILILLQFAVLLRKVGQLELFYPTAKTVISQLSSKLFNSENEYLENYKNFILNINLALSNDSINIERVLDLLQFSMSIEASVAKAHPEKCQTKTVYTRHLDSLYLQKQLRPYEQFPEYKSSILLDGCMRYNHLAAWIQKSHSVETLNSFWQIFYSCLSIDVLDSTRISSSEIYAHLINQEEEDELLQANTLLSSSTDAAKALGAWFVISYFLKKQSNIESFICVIPELLKNPWLLKNEKFHSICKQYVEYAWNLLQKSSPNLCCLSFGKPAELFYRFPVLMAQYFPNTYAKLLERYDEQQLLSVENYAIKSFKDNIEAGITFGQNYKYSIRLFLKLLGATSDNAGIELLLTTLLDLSDNIIVSDIEALLLSIFSKKIKPSNCYKNYLLLLTEKAQYNTNFYLELCKELIRCAIGCKDYTLCYSVWISLSHGSLPQLDHDYKNLLISTLQFYQQNLTLERFEYIGQLLPFVEIDSNWHSEELFQIKKWHENLINKETQLEALKAWRVSHLGAIKALSSISFTDFLSSIENCFRSTFDQERKRITAQTLLMGVKSFILHSNITDCQINEILNNQFVIDELNYSPVNKFDLLIELFNYINNDLTKKSIAYVLLQSYQIFPDLIFKKAFSCIYLYIFDPTFQQIIKQNAADFIYLVRHQISIDIFWHLLIKINGYYISNAWDIAYSDIDNINPDGLVALNQYLIKHHRHEYTFHGLGVHENVISKVLAKNLNNKEIISTFYWLKCYLATNATSISHYSIKILADNFELITGWYPKIAIELFNLIHSKSREVDSLVSQSHLIELNKQLLNLLSEEDKNQFYTELELILNNKNSLLDRNFGLIILNSELKYYLITHHFDYSHILKCATLVANHVQFDDSEAAVLFSHKFISMYDEKLSEVLALPLFRYFITLKLDREGYEPWLYTFAKFVQFKNRHLLNIFSNEAFVKTVFMASKQGLEAFSSVIISCKLNSFKEVISIVNKYSFSNFNEFELALFPYLKNQILKLNKDALKYTLRYLIKLELSKDSDTPKIEKSTREVLLLLNNFQNISLDSELANLAKQLYQILLNTLPVHRLPKLFECIPSTDDVFYHSLANDIISNWKYLIKVNYPNNWNIEDIFHRFVKFFDRANSFEIRKLLFNFFSNEDVLIDYIKQNHTSLSNIEETSKPISIYLDITEEFNLSLFEIDMEKSVEELSFDERSTIYNKLIHNLDYFILVYFGLSLKSVSWNSNFAKNTRVLFMKNFRMLVKDFKDQARGHAYCSYLIANYKSVEVEQFVKVLQSLYVVPKQIAKIEKNNSLLSPSGMEDTFINNIVFNITYNNNIKFLKDNILYLINESINTIENINNLILCIRSFLSFTNSNIKKINNQNYMDDFIEVINTVLNHVIKHLNVNNSNRKNFKHIDFIKDIYTLTSNILEEINHNKSIDSKLEIYINLLNISLFIYLHTADKLANEFYKLIPKISDTLSNYSFIDFEQVENLDYALNDIIVVVINSKMVEKQKISVMQNFRKFYLYLAKICPTIDINDHSALDIIHNSSNDKILRIAFPNIQKINK